MEKLNDFLNYTFHLGKDLQITVKAILLLIFIFLVTSLILALIKRVFNRRVPEEGKRKFETVFSFFKYFILLLVFFFSLDNIGVNVTAIFAASAALLIGIGLALQTLFQDIICGIFVLVDKSVHVDDIIEIDGKVIRVTDISLRTTRGVNRANKVLIIPNHTYLTSTLYNWTQNGNMTRENVEVGVAYGSDVELVKQLLLEAAKNTKDILDLPEPLVQFLGFGESSLDFRLVFTVANSFFAVDAKSEINFKIDRLFRENKVTIPFPQRDVHIYNH
jgi:small-conductance mechanosensitive channel